MARTTAKAVAGMWRIGVLLLPLLILVPKPLVAQVIAYRAVALDDAEVSYSRDAGGDIGTERLLAIQPAPIRKALSLMAHFACSTPNMLLWSMLPTQPVISCVGGPDFPLGIAANCGHSTRPVTDKG